MSEIPTLNDRPALFAWQSVPGRARPVQATGFPESLNGETVTLSGLTTPALTAVVTDEVASFGTVTMPADAGDYTARFSIDGVEFAHGTVRLQDTATSAASDLTLEVNVGTLTFDLSVTTPGATAAQAAAITAAAAAAAAAQGTADDHIADSSGAHAASAISVAVEALAATDVDAALAELRAKVASGSGGVTRAGLRAPAALASEFATWLTAWDARATTPVDIVVIGDSISVSGGRNRWPAVMASALGESYGATRWRGGYTVGYEGQGPLATTGTQNTAVTGADGVDLDVGEYSSFPAAGSEVIVAWSAQPGGGNLEVRDGAVDGTLLATIDTDGAASSGNLTTVALPVGYLFATGTIFVVASGAAATLDGVMNGNTVRVWNPSIPGYDTDDFVSNPALALDLVENVDPDLVIVATGTNDGSGDIGGDITNLVAAVRARTDAMVALFVPPVGLTMPAADVEVVRGLCTSLGCYPIDVAAFIPDFTTSPVINVSDLIHPSARGSQMMGEFVASRLAGDPLSAGSRPGPTPGFAEIASTGDAAYTVIAPLMGRCLNRTRDTAMTQTWPGEVTTFPFPIGAQVITIVTGDGVLTHVAGTGASFAPGSTLTQLPGTVSIGTKTAAGEWLISCTAPAAVAAHLASETTVAGTSEVTIFTLALQANTLYRLDGFVTYTTPAADDARLIATVPSGATLKWSGPAPGTGASSSAVAANFAVAAEGGNLALGGVDGTELGAPLNGWVNVGATAGNLVVVARKVTDTGADMTVHARSHLTCTPIP